MFLDGGIRFYRLDPLTGKELSLSVLNEIDPTTGKNLQDKVSEQTLPVALPDILSCDGKFIYLRSQVFDLNGQRPEIKTPSGKNDLFAIQNGPTAHLFARGGFLEDSGFDRLFWTYGKADLGGHQGDPKVPGHTPTGDILAFNGMNVFGYAGDFKGGKDRDVLFSINRDVRKEAQSTQSKAPTLSRKELKRKKKAGEPVSAEDSESAEPTAKLIYNWSTKFDLYVESLALTEKFLFVAGTKGGGSPVLRACSVADGKITSEVRLPGLPAFDGMAVAQRRLYLTLQDGSILCLEPAKNQQ